jgi:hypothetical protein
VKPLSLSPNTTPHKKVYLLYVNYTSISLIPKWGGKGQEGWKGISAQRREYWSKYPNRIYKVFLNGKFYFVVLLIMDPLLILLV